MERDRLVEHLTLACRLVEEGEIRILKQKQLVAKLAAAGSDTISAEKGWQILEEAQDNHLDHVERIIDTLDKLPS